MIKPLSVLAALALLTGCEPAPVAPKVASPVAEAPAAQPANTTEARHANPLLNVPPDVFMTVIGDCGDKLFGSKPDASATQDCMAAIRAAASQAGLGDISDIQLADPYIGERWRSEIARH
ncbi:hypothetical protein [Jeongeupia sp. USM3]|uniref:hypothetical protein n=1 Tax=Jeongeupia sp. USM3 TaxID=1906741 RepID=UPI00089DF512|nr:hypothetical protein [Jeongeupia sp. USM3]AOX99647.1 hypothetical protein BJP62_03750 [Jeongeupia sp. USM3]